MADCNLVGTDSIAKLADSVFIVEYHFVQDKICDGLKAVSTKITV
jgi:hypothetical protein